MTGPVTVKQRAELLKILLRERYDPYVRPVDPPEVQQWEDQIYGPRRLEQASNELYGVGPL